MHETYFFESGSCADGLSLQVGHARSPEQRPGNRTLADAHSRPSDLEGNSAPIKDRVGIAPGSRAFKSLVAQLNRFRRNSEKSENPCDDARLITTTGPLRQARAGRILGRDGPASNASNGCMTRPAGAAEARFAREFIDILGNAAPRPGW